LEICIGHETSAALPCIYDKQRTEKHTDVLWLYVRHMYVFWCGEAERVEITIQPKARKRPTARKLAGGFFVSGEPVETAVYKSLAR